MMHVEPRSLGGCGSVCSPRTVLKFTGSEVAPAGFWGSIKAEN